MSARPVHRLSTREAELAAAIAPPVLGDPVQRRARRLKQQIEEYWRERGFSVVVDVVDGEMTSNTLNGLPVASP